LRCVESTARYNDFTGSRDGTSGTTVLREAGARIGSVESFAMEVLHTGSLWFLASGVEVDLSHKSVKRDVELVLLATVPVGGCGNIIDPVARRGSLVVRYAHRDGDLGQGGITVACRRVVVDVVEQQLLTS
jgi:hypothetical protein